MTVEGLKSRTLFFFHHLSPNLCDRLAYRSTDRSGRSVGRRLGEPFAGRRHSSAHVGFLTRSPADDGKSLVW